eukprot:3783646-Amphidinium_carterae.1
MYVGSPLVWCTSSGACRSSWKKRGPRLSFISQTSQVNGRQYIQAVETGKHLLIGHPTLQCLEMR